MSYDVFNGGGTVSFDNYEDAEDYARGRMGRVVRDGETLRDFKAEMREVADAIDALGGFEYTGTGGNCDAYQRILPGGDPDDPPHILIVDECTIPRVWDDPVNVGKYESFAGGEGETEYFETVREFIDAVHQGRSRLIPKPGTPAASIAAEDLEAINRHRKGLGMAPLDPGAGWTADELRAMADTIRREGRMFNPKRLKRRLMR